MFTGFHNNTSGNQQTAQSRFNLVPTAGMFQAASYRENSGPCPFSTSRSTFMRESSAYNPFRNASNNGRIVVYANKRDDIDVCVKCFPKMSSFMKNRLNLQPFYNWRDRGHNNASVASHFTCDVCLEKQSEPQTKLSIAIKLVNSGLDPAQIALACSRFDYNGTINEFRNALQQAGYHNSSATELSELVFNEW